MMAEVVYFSNYSGNTHRFVEKLECNSTRIPIKWNDEQPIVIDAPSILFVPTYGGGSETATVPRQVKKFLAVEENRKNIIGVVGFGNTNFGSHFCKAADLVANKLNVPVLDKVEIFGTPQDVARVQAKIEEN
jgi:protein involved in ribonucleotide reduction